MRDSNGTFGQHNPNTYVPHNTNRTPGQRRSNGTLFENQPDHAGIIPAYQASKLKPVDALRYE